VKCDYVTIFSKNNYVELGTRLAKMAEKRSYSDSN